MTSLKNVGREIKKKNHSKQTLGVNTKMRKKPQKRKCQESHVET